MQFVVSMWPFAATFIVGLATGMFLERLGVALERRHNKGDKQ